MIILSMTTQNILIKTVPHKNKKSMRDIRDLRQKERSHRDLSVRRMDSGHLQSCHVKE